MKSVTRNKFLLCFRPVVMEVDVENDGGVDCSTGKVFTYITVEKEEDLKISTMKTSKFLLGTKDCSEIIRRSPKRICSRIFKAVLFQSSLSKRARDRKVLRDSYRSKNSNLSMKSDTNSMLSSSSSSSSLSSCLISEPNMENSLRSDCINQKQNVENHMKRRFMDWSSFNSGLFLLLISLTVTIFWGRICAILFTSIWLYFLHRRGDVSEGRSENVMKSPELESRDYKKRVTMEGLLERRKHHKGH